MQITMLINLFSSLIFPLVKILNSSYTEGEQLRCLYNGDAVRLCNFLVV